jgi:EAL domain-containing protein (putative c-di-GMP-specific phosphodiesterase class I)
MDSGVQSLGAGVRAGRVRQLLAEPDKLSIEYQPVVDVRHRTVCGYEVLARLPGADSPSDWFSGAREEGLGPRLELLVLARSVARLPVIPDGRMLSVNVSVETLLHPGLRELIDATGELAHRIVLEVTEDLDGPTLLQLVPALEKLRETGVRIAVGDAAGGYAGLSGVGALRPDIVKIDRSVVHGAHADDVRRALTELVRSQAVKQGATVVAVGIEDPEDLRLLVESGVRYVQGYLVGRPGPVMTELDASVVATLEQYAVAAQVGSAGLVRQPDEVTVASDDSGAAVALLPEQDDSTTRERVPDFVRVVVTPAGAPVAMVVGPSEDDVRPVPVSLRVGMSWAITEVARAAVAREPQLRYDPVVVVDDEGRLEGVFGIGDLLTHLADQLEG